MSMDANFLRLVEVRQNDDNTSSLWTKGKLESGVLIGVLDKVTFSTFVTRQYRASS